MKTVLSKQYSLKWRDALRGLIVSVLAAVITVIQVSIDAGDLNFDWKKIGTVALSAGIAYVVKNFFEPAKVITTTVGNSEAERVEQTINRVV